MAPFDFLVGVTDMLPMTLAIVGADDAIYAMLIMSALKGISGWFGSKRKKKERGATVEGLSLKQKMSEDQRRARLALARGLLGGVPKTTAGGGVNTNVDIDPALWDQLSQERTYDFGSAVAPSGGTSGFLEGLFGGAAETVPYFYGQKPGEPPATWTGPTTTTSISPLADPTVTMEDLQRKAEEEESQGGI